MVVYGIHEFQSEAGKPHANKAYWSKKTRECDNKT